MSVNFLMVFLLGSSSILCFFVNSWVSIWALLEINTLSFCSTLKMTDKTSNPKDMEMMMKYLIIQSIASAMLLMACMHTKGPQLMTSFFTLLALTSLILKMASAPLHQWFTNMAKSLKWMHNAILFTWQKLAPLYLILFQTKALMFIFMAASATTGSIMMINKKSLKSILAYSSIFNISWLLLAITLNTKAFLLFILLYWISVLMFLYLIMVSQSETIEDMQCKMNKWLIIPVLASLAGVPPLIGFMAKWITFLEGLKLNLKVASSFLLIVSTVNLFIYMRMMNSSVIQISKETQKYYNLSPYFFSLMFMLMNIITILSLSF